MRTKIFTQIFAIAIGLIVVVMNCYAQDTRYLVVENNEGIEKAAFYLSEIPVPVNGVLTLKSTENKPYEYKTLEHRFRFDTRPYGQATSVEQIAIEKWTVSYTNGMLHIDNPVGDVYIYSIIGTLIKVAPRVTDIPVHLQTGNIYIIKSGQHTVKLRANNNGVTASAEPKTNATFVNSQPFMLRSGLSTYSDDVAPFYWNIGIVPISINDVDYFQFNTIGNVVVTYDNGNTVEFPYENSSFSEEPAQPISSDVNWNLTFKHGGANLDIFGNLYFSAAIGNKFVVYDATRDKTTEVPINSVRKILFDTGALFPYEFETTGDQYGQIGCSDWDNSGNAPFVGMIFKVLVHYNDGTSGYQYQCKHLTEDRGDGYNAEQYPNGCRLSVSFGEVNGKLVIKTNIGSHIF